MEPISAIAAGAAIAASLKELFFKGGSDADPELVNLQKQIGQALLNQFNDTRAITSPFQAALAEKLKARTGQQLPISRANTDAFKPALTNVTQGPQNLAELLALRQQGAAGAGGAGQGQIPQALKSFLGQRAQLPSRGV